jgi:methyl-accepting chemotaxis protein
MAKRPAAALAQAVRARHTRARGARERMVTVSADYLVDLRGQLAAISKTHAVIHFTLEGTILTANDNFLRAMGYTLEEIRGKHHSLFVEPGYRDSADYRHFWERRGRGESETSRYKRIGNGGRVVWLQASYSTLLDSRGRPYKIVNYATDITTQLPAVAENARIRDLLPKARLEEEVDALASAIERLLADTVRMVRRSGATACTVYDPTAVRACLSKELSATAVANDA